MDQVYQAVLTDAEFSKLSALIYKEAGIKLPLVKRKMLQSRLHKRLRALGYFHFKDYIDYLFSSEGQQLELQKMVNVVSTNKTEWFREPMHFNFLQATGLAELLESRRVNPLKIWSAACSSGEEVYSILMTLEEYTKLHGDFPYQILGTDISTDMIAQATRAIYAMDRAQEITPTAKKKYFLKGKDDYDGYMKVKESFRRKVMFRWLNLMHSDYDVKGSFDVIFCRNVLIYFDRETQEQVIRKLCRKLRPGGYFFLGHSESITQMDVPLIPVQPTVFRKGES